MTPRDVRIGDDLSRRLEEFAAREGVPVDVLVARAVERMVTEGNEPLGGGHDVAT